MMPAAASSSNAICTRRKDSRSKPQQSKLGVEMNAMSESSAVRTLRRKALGRHLPPQTQGHR